MDASKHPLQLSSVQLPDANAERSSSRDKVLSQLLTLIIEVLQLIGWPNLLNKSGSNCCSFFPLRKVRPSFSCQPVAEQVKVTKQWPSIYASSLFSCAESDCLKHDRKCHRKRGHNLTRRLHEVRLFCFYQLQSYPQSNPGLHAQHFSREVACQRLVWGHKYSGSI